MYMFILMIILNCILLSATIMIFRATPDFEWQTINNQLSRAEFSDTLLAVVIIVSFVDIWLNLRVMILQLIRIMYVVLKGKDKFSNLFFRDTIISLM